MAKNTCKLCSRRFASPRALAGHMRLHSIASARSQISSASSASTSFAAGDEDADANANANAEKSLPGYVLRENPKRSIRLAEPDFSDRESETDYSSQRAKHAHAGSGDAEQVSSVSDAPTPEEDVALSLMMLSRDFWPAPPRYRRALERDSDEGSDGGEAPPVAQKRKRYQCGACKKEFRSYQALGGHRASNMRGGRGGCCAPPLSPPAPPPPQPLPKCDVEEGAKPQPHECPYCFRVFASGQALGGHKRSHLCSAAAAAASAAGPAIAVKGIGLIDLNLPAPAEDAELSAVSDSFLTSKPGS